MNDWWFINEGMMEEIELKKLNIHPGTPDAYRKIRLFCRFVRKNLNIRFCSKSKFWLKISSLEPFWPDNCQKSTKKAVSMVKISERNFLKVALATFVRTTRFLVDFWQLSGQNVLRLDIFRLKIKKIFDFWYFVKNWRKTEKNRFIILSFLIKKLYLKTFWPDNCLND